MKQKYNTQDIKTHFEGKKEVVRETYDKLLKTLRKHGPVTESPRRRSIHLRHATTLADVSPRNSHLILTFKSDSMLSSPRIHSSERVSRHRFHLKVKLSSPSDINQELIGWLNNAYTLSAPSVPSGEVDETIHKQ